MNQRVHLILSGCVLAAACHSPPAPTDAEPWLAVLAPTTASLRGLAAVDATIAWVGGAGGTLLRTVDGGRSWQDVRPADAAGCDFRDLHAFDADTALAMVAGQPARLYRTADGGSSWQIVLADARPEAFFDAIAFAGDDGVLFGDAIDGGWSLWRSVDRGRSWNVVPPAGLPRPQPGEAGFAASGTCVAMLGPARLAIATGGTAARWLDVPLAAGDAAAARAVDLPLRCGEPSQGAFGIAVRGATTVVVGGDYQQPQHTDGTAVWSDDGGRSWHVAAGGAGGYRSAVLWLDRERLLAVGSNGASLSVDAGRSWREVGNRGFHSLAQGRDGSVWACGADGRIARWRGESR